jgi:predicted PurR-regulated permease PerM
VANPSTTKPRDTFFILCGLVLITACLYWARQVLIPVALAVLLAFVLTPAVSALQRRGLGRLPSVILVVLLALMLLGGAGYFISRQINALIANLPNYQGELTRKFEGLRDLGKGGPLEQAKEMFGNFFGKEPKKSSASEDTKDGQDTSKKSEDTKDGQDTSKKSEDAKDGQDTSKKKKEDPLGASPDKPLYVQMDSSGWSHIAEVIGPTAEGLADAFLVVVLVVFMLIKRENLRNRFVRLIGRGRLIATTQAFDEGAQRVSRYLYMLLLINTFFGVVLAIGLFVMGWVTGHHVLWHYALLWGFVALILRFIPYLGTWLAAALLTGFSIAVLPDWGLPLIVFTFFLVLELLTANVIEPLLFGHSTGVSPLALLLAAAFWIWLWGPVGLILSTPLTVVLVVLGKYVPELKFFEVMLGDEPALSADVTFYQRLVARDLDEAADLAEDHGRNHPPESVYEGVLLPALLHARRDRQSDELGAEDYDYVLQGIRDTEEDLSAALVEHLPEVPETRKALAVGWPGRDEGDELALVMLGQMLRLKGYTLDVISSKKLTAELLDHLKQETPVVVCIGSLPPGGLAQTRYLCKRIRQQAPGVKILVGRWGDGENVERMEKRLREAGADLLATTLHDSRDQIVPLLQVAANAAQVETKSEMVTSR